VGLRRSLRTVGSGLLARWPIRPLVARKRLMTLDHALAAGLPEVLAEPLRFLATNRLPEDAQAAAAAVEAARRLLPKQGIAPYGWLSHRATPLSVASVNRQWGLFLHLCARALAAETICEFGTAVGISGSYLALAPSCRQFYGLDGSAARLDLAKATFSRCGIRTTDALRGSFDVAQDVPQGKRLVDLIQAEACLVLGPFEETVPRLLASELRIDLAYVDGDHRRQPTLDIFEQLTRCLRPGALVIFDDIRWTVDMFETWGDLSEWPGFSDTVDVGRMGLGVWIGGDERPRVWDIAKGISWPKPVRVATGP
jgi:predicted O-methyltransferase YrrM